MSIKANHWSVFPDFPRHTMPPKKSRTGDSSPTSAATAMVPDSPTTTEATAMDVDAGRVLMFGGDFTHCELRGFTGSTGADNKNAKLIMMNASAIPCCPEKCNADEKKSTPVKMTVVACHSPGFSVAPYVVPFGGGKGKPGDQPKPLTMVEDGALRMWPFKSETVPGSRGPRYDDQSFVVRRGDTFVLWVSKMDFLKRAPVSAASEANSLFPPGVEEIPAFSLLEVHVMSKSGDPTRNRAQELVPRASCVRFCMIRQAPLSLYSYVDSLRAMPTSLEAARHAALAKKEEYAVISRDVETQDVAFFLPAASVSRHATISDHVVEAEGFVSVVGWSEDPMDAGVSLDISVPALMRAVNGVTLQWTMTLLEIAVNMQAVDFLVFVSDYFRKGEGLSHLRAVPVLDTRRLFACVSWEPAAHFRRLVRDDGEVYLFDTGATHRDEAGADQPVVIAVVLGAAPLALEGAPLPTRDLIICARPFAVPKAHLFQFCLGRGTEDAPPAAVLRGYLRVGASAAQAPGALKRARFGCDDE